METENDNQLPFLDVLMHRKPSGNLRTTVYKKATNTRQILSYHSKHPARHQCSCVRALYKRAETHYNELHDRKSEMQYLQRLFMVKSYSLNFTERGKQSPPNPSPATDQPKLWRALTYIDGVSEAVSRLLKPLGIGIAHQQNQNTTSGHETKGPSAPG
ncbi:unnamed protein product [Dibothriocephalus latus]|uniref:Helix-turn-helix domain-containing protein n=1 Tax=Dibothriocephalus latus TaxID=60516 RepID=A0A3P7NSJ4_DIBLA|nr:unnamed protein product [Dibothriocephalus latus]